MGRTVMDLQEGSAAPPNLSSGFGRRRAAFQPVTGGGVRSGSQESPVCPGLPGFLVPPTDEGVDPPVDGCPLDHLARAGLIECVGLQSLFSGSRGVMAEVGRQRGPVPARQPSNWSSYMVPAHGQRGSTGKAA